MWSYVYQKSEFYLQLEDDLIAKDDYMEFIVDQLTSVTETGFQIDRCKIASTFFRKYAVTADDSSVKLDGVRSSKIRTLNDFY